MKKSIVYKFNLNYLKNVNPDIDVAETTKKYKEIMLPYLQERFRNFTVKVQAVRSKTDDELHDVEFKGIDNRTEEIQINSMFRRHLTVMFEKAPEWLAYKKEDEQE